MQWLVSRLRSHGIQIAFNMVEIGARPIEGQTERFYRLLKMFPSSRLSGFEADTAICDDMNRTAPGGVRYHPHALGRTQEQRTFYDSVHPMCSSLYPFDERYAELYNGLDQMRIKSERQVETISLDQFARAQNLGAVDFIKIDVQGAELDVFQGAADTLRDVLFVVCEVEFVPLYKGQPLFGDVAAHLRVHDFSFHKFLGMAGRVMKPLSMHGRSDYPMQYLWSDAVFIRALTNADALNGEQLLKLAVLADLYESNDISLHLLRRYDAMANTDIGDGYLQNLTAAGPWKAV